jgi:hypothetical protein
LLNAKEIAYIIIDGDIRSPTEIAKDKNLLGANTGVAYEKFIDEVILSNK